MSANLLGLSNTNQCLHISKYDGQIKNMQELLLLGGRRDTGLLRVAQHGTSSRSTMAILHLLKLQSELTTVILNKNKGYSHAIHQEFQLVAPAILTF